MYSSSNSSPKIKVLHLIDSGGLYGAEKMLLSLVSEQIKQGLKPLILSVGTREQGEKPLEVEAKELGLPVKRWRMGSGFNLLGMLSIAKFANNEGFNLYHSHGYKFNIFFGMLPKAFRFSPVLSTIHGYVLPARFTKMRIYLFLDRIFLSRLDKVVFVSSLMLQQPFFKALELQNSSVVENGIDLNVSFNVTGFSEGDIQVQAIANTGATIGYIGRLSHEKGVVYLIDAFSKLLIDMPDALLVICGDGPLKTELLEKVECLGISDKVFFTGYISDVKSALEKMDIFVMPSLTEGMPIVLLEAMALAKSIVATGVGGIPLMLDEGRAGVIVEVESAASIANALKALQLDRSAADSRGRVAKQVFYSRFSSVRMAENYLKLYQELIV